MPWIFLVFIILALLSLCMPSFSHYLQTKNWSDLLKVTKLKPGKDNIQINPKMAIFHMMKLKQRLNMMLIFVSHKLILVIRTHSNPLLYGIITMNYLAKWLLFITSFKITDNHKTLVSQQRQVKICWREEHTV